MRKEHCDFQEEFDLTRDILGDKDAIALWERFRDLSIVKYKNTYKRLNVEFDTYWGESKVKPQSIASVMDSLKSSNLITTKRVNERSWENAEEQTGHVGAEESGLALAVDLEAYKLGKPVLQRPGMFTADSCESLAQD